MSDTTQDVLPKNPILSDKTYVILEWLARVLFPALAVLYAALAGLWHFPYVVQVVGTIAAIDTFLGVFIGYAQRSYDSSNVVTTGEVTLVPVDGQPPALQQLSLDTDPTGSQKLVLKVNPGS